MYVLIIYRLVGSSLVVFVLLLQRIHSFLFHRDRFLFRLLYSVGMCCVVWLASLLRIMHNSSLETWVYVVCDSLIQNWFNSIHFVCVLLLPIVSNHLIPEDPTDLSSSCSKWWWDISFTGRPVKDDVFTTIDDDCVECDDNGFQLVVFWSVEMKVADDDGESGAIWEQRIGIGADEQDEATRLCLNLRDTLIGLLSTLWKELLLFRRCRVRWQWRRSTDSCSSSERTRIRGQQEPISTNSFDRRIELLWQLIVVVVLLWWLLGL